MKSNAKSKIIILITLGILFAFSPIFTTNLNINSRNSNKSSDYSDDFTLDNENLKVSAVSGKIHIDGNLGWANAKTAGIVTGNGTYSEPYVIEDLIIDGGGSGSGIWIENSSVYFKIENCTVYDSGGFLFNAGILLNNTDNGLLIDNNSSSSQRGIYLIHSNNNTISGNSPNNNYWGISLDYSNNNTILRNFLSDNGYGLHSRYSFNNTFADNELNHNHDGFILWYSDDNLIKNNEFIGNEVDRLSLIQSNFNNISGNQIYSSRRFYDDGIYLLFSDNNNIKENVLINTRIMLSVGAYNIITNNNITSNLSPVNPGISLYDSNYTQISENRISGFPICIFEDEDSIGNVIQNNYCDVIEEEIPAIPGYNLFFLLGILSVVVIILSKKLKKS